MSLHVNYITTPNTLVLSGNVTISSTGALTLPKGTSVQRPVNVANGMIRFNTSENHVEYYNQNTWYKISGTIV